MRESTIGWGLAALVVAAPLALGGVHPATQIVLSAAALALAATAVVARGRHGVRVVPFVAPAVIAVGWTALQLLPLPARLVALVSPGAHELRAETGAGGWMPLTLDVPATVLELVKGFAALALLALAASVARRRHRARPMVWALAAVGALEALLVLGHPLVGAHKIYGVYQPESVAARGFFGSFVNGNHAASVLSLGALTSLGLAAAAHGGRRFACALMAALSTVALLFTASRAGTLGLGVGGLLFCIILLSRRWGWFRGLVATMVVGLVAASATLWLADGLRLRLAPSSVEQLWVNQKTRGWADGLQLARAYAWTGVGRGAFEAPVAAFRSDDEAVRLVYPENLLVQSAAEWGMPMTVLLVGLALGAAAHVLRGARRLDGGVLGAATGVVAVVVHELADFGLEMPGVAFPTVIALGVVIGRAGGRATAPGARRASPQQAGALLGAWAVALALAVWAAPRTLRAESRRLDAALHAPTPTAAETLSLAIARHPADDHLELVAASDDLRTGDAPSAMRHLNRALRLHPANWQGHRLAARLLAAAGRRSQAALEYRLALERGMGHEYAEMLSIVGAANMVDAAPRHENDLLDVARWLASNRHAAEADQACLRAVEVSGGAESSLVERVRVAALGGVPSLMVAAVDALLAAQPQPLAYAVAATALDQAGQPRAADEAVLRGLKQHPEDGALVLFGARQRFDHGDLVGARVLLRRESNFSLAERRSAEELLAQIEDKAGDRDAAVLARARARLIARKLGDPVGWGGP
jgi:O-antigen ligase/Tfp pilus assembly protein PilF